MELLNIDKTELGGDNYHYYHNPETNTIICTTLYKGKTVRATAKLNPEDLFNIEDGKKLAYLRCKNKVMKKKTKRAIEVYARAVAVAAKANKNFRNAADFLTDVEYETACIKDALTEFERELNNR